jgi:large conductance mechanosensitive channel
MLSEFKKFIMKGNVVELAIAVVVGAAFGAVVSALVADFITPLIAAIGGQPDFSALSFTINNSQFNYGHFLNTLLSFLIISAVVFFLVVTPLNKLREKSQNSKKTEADTEKKCPKCLSTIPKAATKCKYCTANV